MENKDMEVLDDYIRDMINGWLDSGWDYYTEENEEINNDRA